MDCAVLCCAENNNYFIKFPPDKITKGYFIVFDILPKSHDDRAKSIKIILKQITKFMTASMITVVRSLTKCTR